ncbi:DUF3034 family protein [Hydrocarboniphaga sp.]|uniref:DUF3034 family protein n=1 Tax=Hydrocarboniphaga sp. TaxID=2033016 RepID=UPI003D105F8B
MKGSKGSGARWVKGAVFAALSMVSSHSWAGIYDDGKVFLTGGVFTVDGGGGGGAVPWATITGYETRDGINGGIGFTYVSLPNYTLNFLGASVGLFDRAELSYMNTKLSTNLGNVDTVALAASLLNLDKNLGLDPNGSNLHMETYGVKVRLFGDAVYTSDSFLPQTAIGAYYKVNSTKEFVKTLSADKAKDYELYAAFTKVFFRYSTLINLTVRYTSANQIGLTGFGTCDAGHTNCDNDKEFRMEFSAAYLLQKNFAIGGEWQQHGNNQKHKAVDTGDLLSGDGNGGLLNSTIGSVVGGVIGATSLQDSLVQNESDWFDVFAAYAPNKNYSITLAYLFLGDIAIAHEQNGLYLALHATF